MKKFLVFVFLFVGIGVSIAAINPTVPNRIANDLYLKLSNSEDSITAHAGGGQSSAYALTAQFSRVNTVATAADSVVLPEISNAPMGQTLGSIGAIVMVRNDGANSLQVYGVSPDTINGVATGTGVPVAAGETAIFVAQSFTQSAGAGNWVKQGQSSAAAAITGGTIDGTTIGGTTPASGSFTTLSSTGATSLQGTITNDNAAAGKFGEYTSATLTSASAVAMTTGNTFGLTSASLTAGDWDVSGVTCYHGSGTTNVSDLKQGISATSGVMGGLGTLSYNYVSAVIATSGDPCQVTPPQRFSLATTTSVYLNSMADFTVSTLTSYGFIRARRAR